MENKQAVSGAPTSTRIGGLSNDVPQTPSWFIYLRYAQVVLTLIVFVCSCVSVSQGYFFGWGGGFGIFTCIYTFIYLAAVILVPIYAPQFYFKWFCLGAESFAVLWWLCTFAGLATWASLLNPNAILGYFGSSTAYGASAAGAAFGAFTWVSFCVSLFFYGLGCHRARIAKAGWPSGGVEGGQTSMGPIGAQNTGPAQPVYDATPEPAGYNYQGQQQQYPNVPTPAPQQPYH